MVKKIIVILLTVCFSVVSQAQDNKFWELVYENDSNGKTIKGNIENLIDAIRNGKQIRIYWSSHRKSDKTKKVEHLTEAKFLTIMSDTIVFAQIAPILGQKPNYDAQSVTLNEQLEWTLIAATNGKSDTMLKNTITGEIISHKLLPLGVKWFVKK